MFDIPLDIGAASWELLVNIMDANIEVVEVLEF